MGNAEYMGCKSGYNMNTEHGCLDIDECQVGKACQGQNKFCVNTEGSFKCMDCDKACNGCESDGPDNCFECATGFKKGKNDVCLADKNADVDGWMRTLRSPLKRMTQAKKMTKRGAETDKIHPKFMMVQSCQIPKKNFKTVIPQFHRIPQKPQINLQVSTDK